MSTPGDNVLWEFISINNNYFEIYYKANGEIRLNYINLLQLNKLYQLKVGKNLQKGFSDLFGLYEEIKNSLANNNFTLMENDNILKIKLKIDQKQYILTWEENNEMKNILKIINEAKEHENKNKINDLRKINDEVQTKNKILIDENINLKDELNKVKNESNIYYQNILKKNKELEIKNKDLEKKNKELEIKTNSLNDLEESKNVLQNENISLNNKIKLLNEEKEKIRNIKIETENKYKILENDYNNLKKDSDISIKMENNNLSISLDDFNSMYGTSIQNSAVTTLDLNSKKEGNKLIKN